MNIVNQLATANDSKISIGIVGARGFVARELVQLICNHPKLSINWVSSRSLKGKSIKSICPQLDEIKFDRMNLDSTKLDSTKSDRMKLNRMKLNRMKSDSTKIDCIKIDCIRIENLSAEQISKRKTDVVILALPNGVSKPYVDLIEQNNKTSLILDLSADHRFHNDWLYSLPELGLTDSSQQITTLPVKISNPGCYATAMQLAIAPLLNSISGTVNCFGISGYSGAGTAPCFNNDPNNLKDNILPYSLVEHIHEKEVTTNLNTPISFSPHVADFFRGINLTIQIQLKKATSQQELITTYEKYYRHHTLVKIQSKIPNLRQVVDTPICLIGGFSLSEKGKRISLVACLDNLLKGAASQAIQNINLAFGFDDAFGLEKPFCLENANGIKN